jgi:osmoprotectant transport system substrate-binding protein
MRHYRRYALGAALLSLAMLAGACGSGGSANSTTGAGKTITVGVSGAFSESKILAEMYAQVLEKAGYKVKRQLNIESRKISDPALFSGQIDLKPEYLASEAIQNDPKASVSGDPNNNETVLQGILGPKNVNVLNFSPAADLNVFVVTKATASRYSLTTVSDLAKVASKFVFGAPPDCPTNPFCQVGLKNTYGITFKQVKPLDFGGPLTVQALKSGAIQVGELFSTSVYDPTFLVLQDDKSLEAADNIVPVIRKAVDSSAIDQLLNAISAKLTTDGMLALNKQVDIDKQDPATVAKTFLTQNGLL